MAEVSAVVAVVLRFLHILFGIMWIGAVAYGVGVLRRVMPRVDPPARKAVMRQLTPVMLRYIPVSAVMTIVFGSVLYLWLGGFDPDLLLGSKWGLVLLTALGLTLFTFSFGMLVGVGSAKRILGHLEEEQCAHGPEVGALQARFNRAQVIVLGFGLAIIALMVVATTHLV